MAAKKKKAGRRKVTIVIEKQVYIVECVQCGDSFETVSARAIYCSDVCKMRAYRERRRDES